MGRESLPPRYANIPTWLLFEVELPRSVRLTAMRIYALGWSHDYEYTDPVTLDDICEWCELSRRQIYDHLCRLASKGVLRYTLLDRAGLRYVFDLRPIRAHGARAGPSADFRTGTALSVVASSTDLEDTSTLEEDQQQLVPVLGGGRGGGGASAEIRTGANGIPDWEMRLEVLDEMGVMEPTRSQVARLEYATVEFLEDWADWFLTQDAVGTGFVVWSIRAGQEAPRLSRDQAARLDIRKWETEVVRR